MRSLAYLHGVVIRVSPGVAAVEETPAEVEMKKESGKGRIVFIFPDGPTSRLNFFKVKKKRKSFLKNSEREKKRN